MFRSSLKLELFVVESSWWSSVFLVEWIRWDNKLKSHYVEQTEHKSHVMLMVVTYAFGHSGIFIKNIYWQRIMHWTFSVFSVRKVLNNLGTNRTAASFIEVWVQVRRRLLLFAAKIFALKLAFAFYHFRLQCFSLLEQFIYWNKLLFKITV